MDSMRIESQLLRKAVAKLASNAIKKKLGVDVRIRFNEPITVNFAGDGDGQLHVDADIFMRKEDIYALVSKLGLD